MTFIVITCIALIIAKLAYQYNKTISVAYYINPFLGGFIVLNLIAIALITNTKDSGIASPKETHTNYTIAIDISESMKSDNKSRWSWNIPTRSDLANQYAKDIIQGLLHQDPSCRINIIVFWGRSFEVVSPTNQKTELIKWVNQINPNMVNRQQDGYDGSDISQALLLSQTLATLHTSEWKSDHKTIMITDGDHNRWVDIYEIIPYIKHPVFIIPIWSASGEVFTKQSIPEKKIDGSPVILLTNIPLLTDIAQRSWWMMSYDVMLILESLRESQQEMKYLLWTNSTYIILIITSIILGVIYTSVLASQWYFDKNLIIWSVFLVSLLIWWLWVLSGAHSYENWDAQDGASPIFLIDRNNDRDTTIKNIQKYIEWNRDKNIVLKYHDRTTQTIYSGKADTSDLQAILNLIQSLSASDAIGVWTPKESSESIQEIKMGENANTTTEIGLLCSIIANLCMLISPLWILQIWRKKQEYQRW